MVRTTRHSYLVIRSLWISLKLLLLRCLGLIFVLYKLVHFLSILVDVFRVLYQMEDRRISLSEMLQQVILFLVLLDLAGVELRVIVILIRWDPELLHRSGRCSLIFAERIVEFRNDFIDELLNFGLDPVELLPGGLSVVNNENLFSLEEE